MSMSRRGRKRQLREFVSLFIERVAVGATDRTSDVARALEIFVSVYGAEAGNLALKGLTVRILRAGRRTPR